MTHLLHKFRFCPSCGSPRFVPDTDKSKKCADCGFEYFLNPAAAAAAFILNERDELLVVVRSREPAKGMLDLPGGFADIDETAEEGVAREVVEETGLTPLAATYLFSLPNTYVYSGFEVKTLDMFFSCRVADTSRAHAMDDAADLRWVPLSEVRPELFGFASIREGVSRFLASRTQQGFHTPTP